jgi:hypothetical protein
MTTMSLNLFLQKGASQKKVTQRKDVHLGETTLGKLLILLLYSWVWDQAKLFPNNGIVPMIYVVPIKMLSAWADGHNIV